MPKPQRDTGNGRNTDSGTVISGTNGNDTLSGLGGSYILSGGKGNDTYIVDADDTVDEKSRGGTDHVISYVDWVLGQQLESLTLAGAEDLSGTGNGLDNVITGNGGDNLLDGRGGDDTLDGGDGTDTAVFAGLLSEYSFQWSGQDLWVTNAIGERDILRNVEFLAFDDTVVAASDVGTASPPPGDSEAPQATGDTISVNEDSSVVIDVLMNDSGDGLSVTSVTNGAMGSVTINADGTLTYAPQRDAHGNDSFSYTITDSAGRTSIASVSVQVLSVNDAPVARADSYSAVAGETFFSTGSVFGNDSDADGDPLALVAYDSITASGGIVQMNADGTFTYTPAAGFTGSDSFTYTVGDGNGGQATATAAIMVGSAEAVPYYVEGLLYSQDWKRLNYPGDYETGATVTYTFLDAIPSYYSETSWSQNLFQAFTEQQEQVTRDALALIENATNLNFVEVASPNDATITFGLYDFADGTLGVGFAPYAGTPTGTGASDVWIDNDLAGSTIDVATKAYYVLLHELGHAIGLNHPDVPAEEDNRQYSVMSYAPHSTMSGDVSGYQLFDIAALQYLYGANTGYATGNNVYDFNALDGAIETIWDAGGHDTLDMSAATHAVNLDLAEGAFSTVAASGSDNLALAFGTVIEDAIGGAYDDRIAGNEAANTLTGNGGADTFVFASNWGNDTITDFTPGEDLLDFSAAGLTFADLEITTAGGDTLISNGDDSVVLAEVTVDDENAFVFV
jgi:hypothetical protein